MNREYPRPQMVRDNYILLDGEWELNGQKILVPYPPQSGLSGFEGEVGDKLNYSLTFKVPIDYEGKRALLHFGAVDQVCAVYVNDVKIGTHEGGYLDFYFDITEALKTGADNTLRVDAIDTLDNTYPYGKQSKNRGGMWYTPVSGIWKSVWLEAVPSQYIKKVKITCGMDHIDILPRLIGDTPDYKVTIYDCEDESNSFEYVSPVGDPVAISFAHLKKVWGKEPQRWSCDNPALYNIKVETDEDSVMCYGAFRSVSIKKIDKNNRVCLNGEPIFLHGVLDQGYFSDGIYTPASVEEYEKDILRMKEMGFNTLRKHIKIEPEQFYYYCDKHGMLVVQDMVNSGDYNFWYNTALPTIGAKYSFDRLHHNRDRRRKDFFITHSLETVDRLHNHPSIVVYTIFNESWGQFEADHLYDILKEKDPTRLYDATSGWFAQLRSDFESVHIYFRNKILLPKIRPMFLSECGGYSLKIDGHLFNTKDSYGYGVCKNSNELGNRLLKMYQKMVLPAIPLGLCGCIYTQLSDVEDEINGLYTYDRQVCKVDVNLMKHISDLVYREMNADDGIREAIRQRREKL